MRRMIPRERVLAALRREAPDKVPWVEDGIEEGLQIAIMGTDDFTPPDLCRKLGMDAYGYYYPKRLDPAKPAMTGDPRFDFYYPNKVTFDFVPPWIAKMDVDLESGRAYVGKGLLTSREALALFDEYLPNPDRPERYELAARWLERYKQEFAVFARVRLGATNTLESMGLERLWARPLRRPGPNSRDSRPLLRVDGARAQAFERT